MFFPPTVGDPNFICEKTEISIRNKEGVPKTLSAILNTHFYHLLALQLTGTPVIVIHPLVPHSVRHLPIIKRVLEEHNVSVLGYKVIHTLACIAARGCGHC